MSKSTKRGLLAMLATLLSVPVVAHHASAPHFDNSKPISIEGVVTKFRLVNPHAYLYLEVTDADGNVVEWNCEMQAASMLRRHGWTPELFSPGTRVKIDGIAARRDPYGCAFQTGYLEDGTEVSRSGVIASADSGAAAAAAHAEQVAGDTTSFTGTWITAPRTRGGGGGPPGIERFADVLNEAGQAAAGTYDERFDDPALTCSPSSIIRVWSEPNSVSEITQSTDEMVIKHEFMDTVRTVDLTTREHPEVIDRGLTGHSVGWFEDSTLVIETVGFAAGVLLPHPGILHSEDMRIVERLNLSEDGTQLTRDYEVTDPQYFTKPYTGRSRWNRSDIALGTYDCTELSGINNVRPAED
jgi:hypothetical protein